MIEPPTMPAEGWIDLHSHLLPGIDDGCQSLAESLDCVRQLISQGYAGTVCTPHFWPDHFPGNLPARIDELVAELQQILIDEGLNYQLWTGLEVRLAEDTISWFEQVGVPTLGAGRCVLVDYWGYDWPEYADEILSYLRDENYQPILAHPERMALDPPHWQPLIDRLLDEGVWLQCNFNSLAGHEGNLAFERIGKLLADDVVTALALDMHRPNSLPSRWEGFRYFRTSHGEEQLSRFIGQQPRMILQHGAVESARQSCGG